MGGKRFRFNSVPAVLYWLFLVASHLLGASPGNSAGPISTIAEFRKNQTQAVEQPVRIQASVTYWDPEWRMLFVQDETGGVQIDFPARQIIATLGDRVMIEGVISGKTSAPGVPGLGDMSVWLIGGNAIPKAVTAGFAELAAPENDARFVEVRGFVRSALDLSKLRLVLIVDGQKVNVWIRQFKQTDLDGLLNAQVAIQGVCKHVTSEDGRQLISIVSTSFKLARIIKPGPSDPFATKQMSIRELSSTNVPAIGAQLVRTRGRVVHQELGDSLIIQDDTGRLLVRTPQRTPLAVDDRVDVIGYPLVVDGSAVMEDAQLRIVESSRLAPVAAQANSSLPTLDSIGKIHELTREQARMGYPVKVKGIITHSDPSRKLLFIQDGDDAIYIDAANDAQDLKSGQKLLVSGVTSPGGVLTMISAVKLEVIGEEAIPAAKSITFQDAISGAYDCRRIKVKGTVQWIFEEENHLIADLVALDGRYRVTIMAWRDPDYRANLLNSVVQIEGVCMVRLNALNAPADIVIPVDREQDVEILDKAPADKFGIPVRRIGDVLGFIQPNVASQRLKIKGVVTLYRPGREIYLQDVSGGIRALIHQTDNITAGDEVELIGFRALDACGSFLQNAEFRFVQKGLPPAPKIVQAPEVLGGTNHCELIQLEAALLETAHAGAKPELLLESRQVLFHVTLEPSDSGRIYPTWHAGSRLRITGVCRMQAQDYPDYKSFRILARSAGDIVVITKPFWFTIKKAALLAAGMGVVILASMGWILALRRRVRQQTALIREQFEQDEIERRRLESQLHQARKMESIGQLAAGVAHDFNNILTVIQGHASLLLSDPQLSSFSKESSHQIAASAERAADLIRQLLAFSRKQIIQLKIIDINEELIRMAKILERVLGEHIKLETRITKPLPSIKADPGMIGQVIMNLAVNARDAMCNGGLLEIATSHVELDSKLAAEFDGARPGRFVRLDIKDTGCGMDEATQQHLFEPFFTTKEIGKGTGLGLSTVYGIVKQHEGFIHVTSKPGEGTVFSVFLPVDGSPVDAPLKGVIAESLETARGAILVVEDEPALRKLAARILEQRGFKILQAENGNEALELWGRRHQEIDMLLTDMVMPEGVSGGELARRLGAQKPSLKIIFVSGYSPELLRTDVELMPDAIFLSKPYTPSKLIQVVSDAFANNPGAR